MFASDASFATGRDWFRCSRMKVMVCSIRRSLSLSRLPFCPWVVVGSELMIIESRFLKFASATNHSLKNSSFEPGGALNGTLHEDWAEDRCEKPWDDEPPHPLDQRVPAVAGCLVSRRSKFA